MSNHKNRDRRPQAVDTAIDFLATGTGEAFGTIAEEVSAEEVVETVEQPVQETVYGVVTGCQALNVRTEPSASAAVASVVKANSEVVVNEAESTDTFYKVCTSAGVEGFCMKEFITIK